jgi:CHAT domain-containing protein
MLVTADGGEIRTDRRIPYVAGARFLTDRNRIYYYQSLTALTLARTLSGRKADQENRLLVTADPVFEMRDPRAQQVRSSAAVPGSTGVRRYTDLMAAMEEAGGGAGSIERLLLTGELADKLRTMYGGRSDVFTGMETSKAKFLKDVAPGLGRYRSIVFATHGYFGTKIPGIMEPVLLLNMVPPGTDGFLRMSEVMGLKMNADVVALTACQSGLGKALSGEGTMGMGRAFQYAGGKSVLMSLWSVSETSSVKLVEDFFKLVKEGKSKLDALQKARTAIREEGYDHPFFWAPFILVGEPN